MYRHGMYSHPTYRVWNAMRNRCRNPNDKSYSNYGGRGIQVCDSWNANFVNFWADMGATYEKGLQLDRKDNDKGYNIDNCRWASKSVNAKNKRNKADKQSEIDGVTYHNRLWRSTFYFKSQQEAEIFALKASTIAG